MKKSFCLIVGILLCGLLVQTVRAEEGSMSQNLLSYGLFAGSSLNSSENTFPSSISFEALWAPRLDPLRILYAKPSYLALGLVVGMSDTAKNIQGVPVNVVSQGAMLVAGLWTNRVREFGLFDDVYNDRKGSLTNLGVHGYVGCGVSQNGENSKEFALARSVSGQYKVGAGFDWKFKAGKDDADFVLDFSGTFKTLDLVPVAHGFTAANNELFPNLAVQLGVRVWH